MPSSLFNQFGNQPTNGFQNFMQQFNQFRESFSGDPKQQVQEMLNSGRMSQDQFNQAASMASQIMKMIGK